MRKQDVLIGERGPFHGMSEDESGSIPRFDRDEMERILRDLEFWNGWTWEWDGDTLILHGGWGDSTYTPDDHGLYALLDPGWEFTLID